MGQSHFDYEDGFGERQKNWRSGDCQFCYVMGDAEQAPFGFGFLQAPQEEPAKASILLDASENGLHINGALFSQRGAWLG